MKRWKWRIVLSIANLLLALGMSALGAREWAADARLHPEYFFHGNLYYVPAAQWLSYCLNAFPFYVVNLLGSFAMRHHLLPPGWFGTYCFYFVHYEYYLALFLFWWWIGWEIDIRGTTGRPRASVTFAEAVVGIMLSVMLLFQGIADLRGWVVVHTVAASMVAWGVGLLCYFMFLIWRGRSARLVDH